MINPRREAVIAEAETWIKTPYIHMGRVKGAGVDCLTLLAEVYERAGVIPHVEIEFYPPDWNLHRDEERYLAGVLRCGAKEFWPEGSCSDPAGCEWAGGCANPCRIAPQEIQPADIVLVKFGRCYAHGAIVVEWPHRLIHAHCNINQVGSGNADSFPFLESRGVRRAMRFFSIFA